jgi:hypothetical protein
MTVKDITEPCMKTGTHARYRYRRALEASLGPAGVIRVWCSKPFIYLAPLNAVRTRFPVRFHPFQRGRQAFTICHQCPILSRPGIEPLSPLRTALL